VYSDVQEVVGWQDLIHVTDYNARGGETCTVGQPKLNEFSSPREKEGKRERKIDWCCLYYFVRNSLVALLEALCARILFFRFVNIGFFLTFLPPPPFFFWVCAKPFFVSNKRLSSAALNQAPVPDCHHSCCVLIIHVCLCVSTSVCASVCACENV